MQESINETSQEMRLNKALSVAGFCSRRKADELIKQGKVEINGELITEPGIKVDPKNDRVEIQGKQVDIFSPTQRDYTYILLNKPIQVISSTHDPEGRETILDILPDSLAKQKLVPAGRLDYMSEGLLMLSNDGDFINKITHPGYEIPKKYLVRIRGEVDKDKIREIENGMTLQDGEKLAPVGIEKVSREKGKTFLLELFLHQGKNRQIRRMCRDLDLTVLKLQRTRQGPIELDSLPPGKFRYLTNQEINELKQIRKK